MKFIIVLAFSAVFLCAITRAEDEDEEYDDEEGGLGGRLLASAMQLNNNNVGDIHNVKGIFAFIDGWQKLIKK